MSRRGNLFACLPVVLALGCATTSTIEGEKAVLPGGLDPTERWLVTRQAPEQPLPLVENETPAGDRFLRTPSRPLSVDDPDLDHLLARMRASVEAEEGVGIAAPQVGISRRIIWVRRLDQLPDKPFRAYLNPEIVNRSEESVVDWEGCLSIPAGFGQVSRAAQISIAHDLADGTRVEERVEGFTARIFQHEIDHLDGVLFIDRMPAGKLLPEQEYRELRARERGASPGSAVSSEPSSGSASPPSAQPSEDAGVP